MKRPAACLLAVAMLLSMLLSAGCASSAPPQLVEQSTRFGPPMALPAADTRGTVPLETALSQRRSQRDFDTRALPLATLGQLLWAGQGTTDAAGRRAAPSAGGLYPVELYAVTPTEVAHYLPVGHRIEVRRQLDIRPRLQRAALDQSPVGSAPVTIVVASVPGRTAAKYGRLAATFIALEAGHVAQNILLEATTLRLAAVPIGGINAHAAADVLALLPGEDVLYLIPVGFPPG